MDLSKIIANEFPQDEDLVYLNHAGVSPWPCRTAESIRKFAIENVACGAVHYPQWLKKESELRHMLRDLINAPSANDIALLKSTSEGLSVIAYGLDWQAGDNIVTTSHEFPSNRIVWESLQAQGVVLRQADLDNDSSAEDALISLIDDRTRLLTVSSVQFGSGIKLNLRRLGDACRSAGVLFCVDAIQSLGIIPMDVQSNHADFIVADGHKWLMAAEGLALFYCRDELRERLRLKQYGWHMVENATDYDSKTWQIAASARRFECGSPNMLGIHALHASLSLLLDIGIRNIEKAVHKNIVYLREHLNNINGIYTISPVDSEMIGGILSFRHRQITTADLFRALSEKSIVCALRNQAVRFSPHFYLSRDKLDRALSVVDEASI